MWLFFLENEPVRQTLVSLRKPPHPGQELGQGITIEQEPEMAIQVWSRTRD